ncbi:hypothetical protein SUGI_0211590 [Cryptomeria japonica]|nr:hypothetical protein SUGI_0211590 [Cryptomeria japonica]
MTSSILEKRALSPLRRMWRYMYKRLCTVHKKKTGIYILYEDVKSCNDEDVNVLWSIVVNIHNNTHYANSVSATVPTNSNPSNT